MHRNLFTWANIFFRAGLWHFYTTVDKVARRDDSLNLCKFFFSRTIVSHFSGNTMASITRSWRLAALTRLLVNQEGFLDKLGDYHDCRYERIGRGSCCPKADVRAFNVHHGGKRGKREKVRRHQNWCIGCDTSRRAASIALIQIDFYLNRRFELEMRISMQYRARETSSCWPCVPFMYLLCEKQRKRNC